jgi:hypothetical protein
MNHANSVMCFSLSLAAVHCVALASAEIRNGREEGFWDNHAVMVVRVAAVDQGKWPFLYDANVDAVLATHVMVPTRLEFGFKPDVPNLACIRTAIYPKEHFVLCLERQKDGRWIIPDVTEFEFLPNQAATRVAGADDPAVAETCRRVQAALAGRQYGPFVVTDDRPDTRPAPTTRPAATTQP